MRWTELPMNEWFNKCVPLSLDAPQDLQLDEPITVDLKNKKSGMCLGVGSLFNAWLAKLNCNQYSTFRNADRRDKTTSRLKDEWYTADRPDLVVYPTHAIAEKAYTLSPGKGSGTESTQAGSGVGSAAPRVPDAAASHSTRDTGFTDSVDVPGVQKAAADPYRAERARMSWDWADLLIEVKHDRKHFPWCPNSLTPTSIGAVKARGRLVKYAQETMGYQHREFVFTVVFCKETARLVRFDRNGAMVSESFEYAKQPSVLGKFLYGLYRPNLPRKVRGHDPTAKLASDADSVLFRSACTLFRLRDDSAESVGLQQAASSDAPVYDLTVTAQWSRSGRSVRKGTPVFTRHYLVGRPKQLPHSMVGRGTRPFIACERRQLRAAQAAADSGLPQYECEPGAVVFIKDYWRAESDKILTELEAYQRLWEKPPADGKLLFPTPIGAGDVYDSVEDEVDVDDDFRSHFGGLTDDEDEDDEDENNEDAEDDESDGEAEEDEHASRTSEQGAGATSGSGDHDGSEHPRSGDAALPLRQVTLTETCMHFDKDEQPLLPRVHTRLIIKEVCRSLEDFKDPMELLFAIFRSIIAHKYAWEIACILHGDISVGNIHIYDQPWNKGSPVLGLLSDWDLAKTKEQLQGPATQRTRSGTWQFMSALLQQYPEWPHGVPEDLESFMHVLNWCILKYLPHELTSDSNPLGLAKHMKKIFDEANPIVQPANVKAQVHKGSYIKYMNVRNGTPFIMGLPVARGHVHQASASTDGNAAPSKIAAVPHPLTALVTELSELCKKHYATLPLPTDSDDVFSIVQAPAPTQSTVRGWDLSFDDFESTETSNAADRPRQEAQVAQTASVQPEPSESPLLSHKAFLLAFCTALRSPYFDEAYDYLWPNFAKTQDQCPYYITTAIASGTGSQVASSQNSSQPTSGSNSGSVVEGDEPPAKRRRTMKAMGTSLETPSDASLGGTAVRQPSPLSNTDNTSSGAEGSSGQIAARGGSRPSTQAPTQASAGCGRAGSKKTKK